MFKGFTLNTTPFENCKSELQSSETLSVINYSIESKKWSTIAGDICVKFDDCTSFLMFTFKVKL